MLIENNSNPKNSIYYIGYELLSYIKTTQQISFLDIESLYNLFTKEHNAKIEFSKFMLLIDWLFMNNKLIVEENGEIVFNVFN